jgi:hypothetical protein
MTDITPVAEYHSEFSVTRLWRQPKEHERVCFALVSDIYWPYPRNHYATEAYGLGSRIFWFDTLGLDGVDDDLIHY